MSSSNQIGAIRQLLVETVIENEPTTVEGAEHYMKQILSHDNVLAAVRYATGKGLIRWDSEMLLRPGHSSKERIQEISDKTPEILVELAVLNAGRGTERRTSRWWHVSEALGIGSTSAKMLCEYYGLDRDEELGGCEVCYREEQDEE